jgi:long-chain acyl-CoA synthetase
MNENDSGYLFLPLSHTYGGIYNFTYCLIFGAALYLCSDISLIAQELQIVRPTIFCAVPRILERFLASAKSSKHPAQMLKQMFGGNLRYLFCSGGPWRTEDRAFYKNSGINLLEAYALTETSSSLSISYTGESETESVGVVFENLDVSIAEPDENGYGEILVRGENVFLGYYNNEQATKAAIDTAGFLHTGDIGKADSTGHLYITGRKIRLFKTSAGEYVSPERIELLLLSRPGIKSAYIHSNAGHVAAAVELSDPSQDIAGIIDAVNRELPAYMHIDEYSVMEKPTDVADSNWKTHVKK